MVLLSHLLADRIPTSSSSTGALESLLISALNAAASLPHLKQTHARILRLNLHHSSFLIAKLLRRLSDHRIPTLPYPHRIFSQVSNPNPFLWTALIRSYALLGPNPHRQPLHLYSLMRRQTPPSSPLSFTFSALLKSCSSISTGTQIHANTIAFAGFDADLFVQNTLIDMYVRCDDVSAAREVFDEMLVRNIISWTSLIVAYTKTSDMDSANEIFSRSPVNDMVSWTAMVSGYAQNAQPKEALETFVRMREAGVPVDQVSLSSAISACAQLGAMRNARWMSDIAVGSGFERNLIVATAMVDMFAKCGMIAEACRVFDGMPERNVYTYSAMIVGLAAHGRSLDAIKLFQVMVEKTDIKPNKVTFIGVLTACSHTGMVDEGRLYFAQMSDVYGIDPSADHYTCMVDLLGRAGLVEEALDLVRSMPVEPHGGVWGALLGACRIHGKIHIAKIAADHLFELEPDGIGNYVLLSNTYASAGMWDKVSMVRKQMRKKKLKKEPSSSWVEAKDGVIHEFFAGDATHPRSREIEEALEELMLKLKAAGYVPVLSSVVYDVSDDEKERLLKDHSEKLALAFKVLTTSTGTVRIVKNLRICEDCHLVMCLASLVLSRQIMVRDNLRFHHFKDGACSCGGFW